MTFKNASSGQRALAFSRDGSAFRQIIEQTRLEWLQCALLLAEEVRLRLACALALERVTVERVLGDILLPGFEQLGGELVSIDSGERVIHEVLKVI